MNSDMEDNSKTWMEPSSEPDIQLTEFDISSSPNDFNVATIASFLEAGSIILPPYQRNYTWDKARASKLIESVILGLPIPQLFFYEENRNKFSVLDGQQRLLSIYFFMKKRFPKREQRSYLREIFVAKGGFPSEILSDDAYFESFNIYLPGYEGEKSSVLHGLNYDTLGIRQAAFNLRTLRCVIIKQNEPKGDNSSVFEIFDRLNTGGMNMHPQEIRANLYYSEFYKLIYELNKDQRWRQILGTVNRDEKLRDIELLLRAFSMLCYAEEYKPSMTRFLNKFSRYAKDKFSAADIEFLKYLFDKFLSSLADVPVSMFKLSGRFSIAVFESTLYGSCRPLWDGRKLTSSPNVTVILESKIDVLLNHLRPSLQEGTTKQGNIESRLKFAAELFRTKVENV